MNVQTGTRRLLSLAFNQDNSCLSIGTKDGYKIFNCDTCSLCYERSEGAISVVEMLFSSSLVAIVGAGEQPALSPRRLSVFNTTTGMNIAELNFVSSILGVRMNRKRLVVVLERKTYIHDLGQLNILDTIDHVRIHEIQAHRSPLAAMSFSSDGLLLATASTQGTVIRVHCIPQASKLMMARWEMAACTAVHDEDECSNWEADDVSCKWQLVMPDKSLKAFTFRRGSYPATIYSLSFGSPSRTPQLLAASCASGTIHVFKLGARNEDSTGDGGKQGMKQGSRICNRTAAGLLASVIPDSMSDMVDSERCFFTIRNGSPPGVRSLCAIAEPMEEVREDGAPPSKSFNRARIFVVTSTGYFHEWSITVGPGKESTCTLQREVALLNSSTSDEISAHFV